MTPQLEFKEISNRDAWSTIRGFVYQIDYTILRWLDVKENDLLELECGEDIDIVQRDLAKQEISRDLEQVKYRDGSVTLNTDLTLELLKNFYDHKINNPGKAVRFRFLTNADYARERPAIFTSGDKGIDRWISLYNVDTNWKNNETVTVLQKHIQNKIAEQFMPASNKLTKDELRIDGEWKAFHSYLDDPENLRDFISTFEWSQQKQDQYSIVKAVLDRIRNEFQTEDPKPIYERLFLFVFKLLSLKGIKRLDAEALKLHHLENTPHSQDKELATMLRSLLRQVDQRLLNLELQSEAQSKALNSVFKDVEVLKNDAVFSYRLQNISTGAPEAILNGSVRADKVKEILDLLDLLPWLAFHGINGSGKTQMASLVSRSFQEVFWLDLREYHSDLKITALAIEFFLATVSGCQMQTDKKNWINQVIQKLPEGCLLVFNDVPQIDESVPGLNELFCILINALDTSTVKVITTSNFAFPDSITQKCPDDAVFIYEGFEFDDKEITEYLVNQGAPSGFLKMVPFITARAHRNPRLTTAMILHLKAINWGTDTGELLEIVMNTEFAAGVLESAQQSIIKYIGDQSAKELLYRLSLISWTFSMDQVQAVSKVEQQITYPSEKLQPLLHLWIQLRDKGKYEVSPLIQNIGVNNLDHEAVKNVHIAIGKSILAGKSLNQFSANRAFMAFLSGKDFDNAGMVLLKMYQATVSKEQSKILYSSGLLYCWTNTDFPAEMGIGMKVMIRREQLRLYQLIDKDISILLEKTKKIFTEGTVTIPEGALARLMLVTTYFKELPAADYIDYMSYVVENLLKLEDVINVFHEANMLSNLIWIASMRLITIEDVEAWIGLSRTALKQGVDLFASELSVMMLSVFSQSIVERKDQSDDDARIQKLNTMLDFLTEVKREYLAAYVVRGLVEVESKWYNDPDNAIQIASHYLHIYQDPGAQFLLSAQTGRIYQEQDRKQEAIESFRKALAYDLPDRLELIQVLLITTTVVSNQEPHKAVDYCVRAVEVAREIPSYPKLDLVMLMDELAVAHWLNGDHMQTFLTLEEIVVQLFELRKIDFGIIWIRLFSLTGHFSAYCSAMISDGKPPKTRGEDYFAPYQGMFNNNSNDFSQRYQAKHDSFIHVQMASLAAGLGEPAKAFKWSMKAFDEARSNGSQEIIKTVSTTSAHFALIDFRPTEAFEAYLYNAAVVIHLEGQPKDRFERLKDLDSGSIFSEKPSKQWSEAENTATTFAIVPLFIMLLTAIKDKSQRKNQMRASYLKMLSTFELNASDKTLFDLVSEISVKIMDNKISVETLGTRANNFGHQERRNLQILCLLGVIHLTRKGSERLTQLINIAPQAQKILSAARHILEYTLVPFVQTHAIEIIKSDFVGSRAELLKIETEILNVDRRNANCLREIVNIARKVVEVDIPTDRQLWLDGADI